MTEWSHDPANVSNDQAAEAMLGLVGGLEGVMAQNIDLAKFGNIFRASTKDDLSGLRLIASRMYPRPVLYSDYGEPVAEPMMSPELAREWLLRTQRATEIDGELILTAGSEDDHLSLAGLQIANSEEPAYLSEVYTAIKGDENINPISIANIAATVRQHHDKGIVEFS